MRTLGQFISIQQWLRDDPFLEWEEKVARDRKIYLENPAISSQSSLDQVFSWWEQLNDSESSTAVAERIERLFSVTLVGTLLAGLLLGSAASLAVLYYDGSAPINLLLAFVCLVVLPLLGFFLSLLLPFFQSSGFIGAFNLGGWVQAILRIKYFSSIRSTLVLPEVYERFLRWRLVLNSQLFGLAFSGAALSVLLVKVLLSDLAFAWGSTLSVESGTIYALSETVSRPWALFVPEAVPSRALIENSQYFRLATTKNEALARQLTQWWPFLAMGMLCYGVLLRTVALIVANTFAARQLKRTFLRDPHIIALLDRMHTAMVTNDSEQIMEDLSDESSPPTDTDSFASKPLLIINWQGASLADEHPEVPRIDVTDEGSLQAEQDSFQTLDNGVIWVVSKAWEPPLLECHDFLRALRNYVGPKVKIILMPRGAPSAELDDYKRIWQQSLAKLNDPGLYVQ